MAYSKTTWVDRAVQFFNRFTKVNESPTSVDLTQAPGTVTQAGTPVNATNLNKLEQGVFDAHVTADAALPKAGGTVTGPLSMGDNNPVIFRDGNFLIKSLVDYVELHAWLGLKFKKTSAGITHDILTTETYRTTNGYVEWNNAGTWQGVGGVKSVQRGQATIAAAATTLNVTVTAVVTAKTFLNFTSTNAGSQISPDTEARGKLASATTITFDRAASAGALIIEWEVIEFY